MTEQEHDALRGLLGAWALRACRPDEADELERHLAACADCAEEAGQLRRAAGRLSADDPLDQPDGLRQQVLDFCLTRRAAGRPLASWAAPYAAETAKLDALLRDLGRAEWQEVAELPWHGGVLRLRPAEVLCHLAGVDALLAPALGLPDPAAPPPGRVPAQGPPAHPFGTLLERGERLAAEHAGAPPQQVRQLWRDQSQALLRQAVPQAGERAVDYGFASLPVRDAFIDRAFETWMHGEDVARAVAYPYAQPSPSHLRQMVDLAARMLPGALVGRRQAAYAGGGVPAGAGRTLRLVIEGPAAGQWLIPLDPPADGPTSGPASGPTARPVAPAVSEPVAELVMDGVEFCQLAAAHRDPEHLPVGEYGDRAAIREVLSAVPLLSRP
ncbi:maleylpyruvate isomerase N-terminal domain-containing protein [Kitasatospora viridis]|uniref:Putative zinc finger protein n=1 Tax=Kitasatospora viridis TaxID=281105 RepID=A0A561UGB5_9ACTN|nr:maleylpyruvate isomerase N-terminal domain-containing protein [Kitasatospora viridis]TWF98388.1 putative zinc finger protein [Kitasatospora viridis]